MSIINDILICIDDDNRSKEDLEFLFNLIKSSVLFSGVGKLISKKLVIGVGLGKNKVYQITNLGAHIIENNLLELKYFIEGKFNQWILVSISTPENYKAEREKIRLNLKNLGFGIVRNGLFIGKIYNLGNFSKFIDNLTQKSTITVFQIKNLPIKFEKNTHLYWNLKSLSQDYKNWLKNATLYLRSTPKDLILRRMKAKSLVYQLAIITRKDPKINSLKTLKVLDRSNIIKTYLLLRNYCYK